VTTETEIIGEICPGTHGQMIFGVFFRGRRRPNDGADPQLNASAQDFVSYRDLRRNDNRSQHGTHDGVRTGDLNV